MVDQSSDAADGFFTPRNQINRDFTVVYQEMQNIPVFTQDKDIISFLDQLDKGTPSQPLIIQQLQASHEIEIAIKIIQKKKISNLKQKITRKKSNSRKAINSNY